MVDLGGKGCTGLCPGRTGEGGASWTDAVDSPLSLAEPPDMSIADPRGADGVANERDVEEDWVELTVKGESAILLVPVGSPN